MQHKTLRLTKPQRQALETIRDTQVTIFHAFGGGTVISRWADFNHGMVKRLEAHGLIEVLSNHQEDKPRITDAGRVALGDWAAGERGEA